MLRRAASGALLLGLLRASAEGQPPPLVALPPGSPRWLLEGRAKLAEHLGRPCLELDGGAATMKDLEFRDGVYAP